MDIRFNLDNIGSALTLMLKGMVGIFVVMAIILGVVVLLNKFTGEDYAQRRKTKKEKKTAAKKTSQKTV